MEKYLDGKIAYVWTEPWVKNSTTSKHNVMVLFALSQFCGILLLGRPQLPDWQIGMSKMETRKCSKHVSSLMHAHFC